MAYVNFKEERYKGKKQLNVRRENNQNIIKKLTEDKESLKIEYDKQYSFKSIKDKVINNTKTLREDEFLEVANKNIVCAVFTNCKFCNIKFKECTFYGCIFDTCDFAGGGVSFENCTFVKVETEKTPSLNVKDNLSCEFINCNMYVKFQNSDISYLIIGESNIENTSIELSNIRSIIIYNCEIDKMEIADSDLSGGKFINTYMIDFSFNDKLISKIDEKTFFDKIALRYHNRDEYEGIYEVYETVADKLEENRLKNNFGEYYYQCKLIQRKSLEPVPRIGSFINWFTSGYGERVIAPLISSLVLIFIFAIIYYIIGIDINGNEVKLTMDIFRNFDFKEFVYNFSKSITISTGLFAGIGVLEAKPVESADLIVDIEMVVGVIMVGVGIGTLTRKLVR